MLPRGAHYDLAPRAPLMCYEKSVNIFEWNRTGKVQWPPEPWSRQPFGPGGLHGAKTSSIKENAKYSFVELGKFNTSLYTRRILKRFWRLH